jgi:hypothetical protein
MKAREFVVASYDWDVIAEKLMSDFEAMARLDETHALYQC